ncbi:MAG TPA: hypothetical protein VFS39_16485 [Nitrospira sp.]|nr:hypothetical protein [Nitrospira sp.]
MVTEVPTDHRPRGLSYGTVRRRSPRPRTLALDIGIAWIRGLVLDEQGWPMRPPHKSACERTPVPACPHAVLQAATALTADVDPFDRVSVAFPGRICDGIVVQSQDLGSEWRGYPLGPSLAHCLHRPVRVANATDIQGWGAIRGKGVEMIMTIGPRVRASLFLDGVLVPDVRIGSYRSRPAEQWSRRIVKLIAKLEKRFSYDRLYLGGPYAGAVRSAALPSNVNVVASFNALRGGMALWQDREAW